MMDQVTDAGTADSAYKSLYKVGGVAALIAGVIFRRNLGPEISEKITRSERITTD